jgi:hypothetical protein
VTTPDALAWLRAQITRDKERAEAMEHFTVPDEPFYSCAGSRTEPYGDLEWGEGDCDCFVAERRAEALAGAEAKLAIVTRCEAVLAAFADPATGLWPDVTRRERTHAGATLADLASGYKHREGYAEHWGSGD